MGLAQHDWDNLLCPLRAEIRVHNTLRENGEALVSDQQTHAYSARTSKLHHQSREFSGSLEYRTLSVWCVSVCSHFPVVMSQAFIVLSAEQLASTFLETPKRKIELGLHSFERTASFHKNHSLDSSKSQHAEAAKVANLPADQPVMPDHTPRQMEQKFNILKGDSFSTIKS
jgi:hypothetical protein